MSTGIVQYTDRAEAVARAGQIANGYAKQGEFLEYWQELSSNAKVTREAGLKVWAEYLGEATSQEAAFTVEELRTSPEAWQGTTYGLVKGFKLWMATKGFSVGTINNRLTTVRVYARLAATAGIISEEDEASRIATVKGYSSKTGANLDKGREKQRTGYKKAEHVSLSRKQAIDLMKQPNTPQGRRDALMMTLLIDHGLRVSEVALVDRAGVDLSLGTLRFYRPKVKDKKTIELTKRTLDAMTAYLEHDAPAMGPLMRTSNKHGDLGAAGMSERAIQERVRVLGERVGVSGLSPHDCRHYAATWYAGKKVDTLRLMEMFGWNSPAMARRYVEESKIANEGTKHLAGDD